MKALRNYRDTQYDTGNMVGYHKAANICNAIVNFRHEQNGTVKFIEGPAGVAKVSQIEGRLQSGIIGIGSFGAGDNFRVTSASYAADSTAEEPIVEVRISEENGKPSVFRININEIDPENATQLEMLALCCHADAQGISVADKSGDSYRTLVEYARYGGYEVDNVDDFTGRKQNWNQIVSEVGETESKDTKNITEKWTDLLQNLFESFAKSLTDNTKGDESILNLIPEEEILAEKKASEEMAMSEAALPVYHKGIQSRESALTDQRYTDEGTGVSWYVGEDGRPYMLEEDTKRLMDFCRQTGEDWSRKAAEITGLK